MCGHVSQVTHVGSQREERRASPVQKPFKNHAKPPGPLTVTPQIPVLCVRLHREVTEPLRLLAGKAEMPRHSHYHLVPQEKYYLKPTKVTVGLEQRSAAAGAPSAAAPRPARLTWRCRRAVPHGPAAAGGCADPPPSPRPGTTASMLAKHRAPPPPHQLGSARARADCHRAKP